MPRKLAATLENNAWRSRKRVVADYVPECMHHHANDKAVVRHRPRWLRSARLAQAYILKIVDLTSSERDAYL